MKIHELFTTVKIPVETQFGFLEIPFVIVDYLGDNKYAVISQGRLIIAEQTEEGWKFISNRIDLLFLATNSK